MFYNAAPSNKRNRNGPSSVRLHSHSGGSAPSLQYELFRSSSPKKSAISDESMRFKLRAGYLPVLMGFTTLMGSDTGKMGVCGGFY